MASTCSLQRRGSEFRGFAAVILALATALDAASAMAGETPWPSPVPGWEAPAPGEHPRLFFRKSDLPELKKRAATPEGRQIVARLRRLLGGGGRRLPETYTKHFPVNIIARGPKELPLGAFTMSHAAGYGLLYRLTGEKEYADMARQCLEMMFDHQRYQVTYAEIKAERDKIGSKLFVYGTRKGEGLATPEELAKRVLHYGQPDRDERYTWTTPGAKLRIGPMMLCVAMAYDLCYDGWDEAFRRRVVREILDYDQLPVDFDVYSEGHKGRATMERIVHCSYPPESNHFGAYIGGAGVALLAIRGDPGADPKRVEEYLKKTEEQALRLMTNGFGDHGFFAEGHGPSHMAANTAFVPFLQAARAAWGKDFISPRPNAPWLTLRWVMEVIPDRDGKPRYPNFHPSSYGPDYIDRDGTSDGGEFSQGFGALAGDDQQAALLWVYRNSVEPGEAREYPALLEPGEKSCDALVYPHRAVLALVNWPINLKPKDPAEVIGRVNVDTTMGHYMFRKGWKGPDDVYFSFFLNPRGKHGYVRGPRGGNFAFWGLGLRSRWSHKVVGGRQTYFKGESDGSGVLSFSHGDGQITSIAVDFSEKAGVPGVVAFANPWFSEEEQTKTHWHQLRSVAPKRGQPGPSLLYRRAVVNDVPMLVATVQPGEPPELKVEGDKLVVGRREYRFDGTKLLLGEKQ